MPTLVSELLSSDYALTTSELSLFAIPLFVVALGVGISVLMSCVSNSKSMLLTRLEADEPKTILAQELVKDLQERQISAPAEEDAAEELSAERRLPMATLDGPGSPPPRVGAGAEFDPAAGIFIVAGGMADDTVSSEINIYSVEEKKWVAFQSAAPGFGFLYGYMALLNESVVVFGGIGEDNSPRDVLQIYNFDTLTWEQLPLVPGSPAPSARFNGSATCLGEGRMLLFGGRDGLGQCLNDVWMLELRGFEGVWTMLYAGGSPELEEEGEYIPEPREAHSAAVVGGTLFVLGGSDAEGAVLNTDGALVEAFDLETRRWSLHEARGCAPQVLCSGGSAHALPSVNKILVVCGEESEVSFFNALHILDVSALVTEGGDGVAEWSLYGIDWCGDQTMPPDARLFHAAALDAAEGDLYVSGGQQMSPADGAPALQDAVAVLDLSQVMQLLPERLDAAEGEDADAASDAAMADDEDMSQDDDGSDRQRAESEGSDAENDALHDNAVDLGPLFGGLAPSAAKTAAVDVANETLEDFERVRGEVDLAFASKYSSPAELEAMRRQLAREAVAAPEESGALLGACPMPRRKLPSS